jgi:hypothetical protein
VPKGNKGRGVAVAKPRVNQPVEGDDAEAIKRWGPLAFAVAAADRPELQTAQPMSEPPPSISTEAPGAGRRVAVVVITMMVVAAIAGGALYAWQYMGR